MTAARTYLIFGDIEGKLDVLRVECTECRRKGRYSVRMNFWSYVCAANSAACPCPCPAEPTSGSVTTVPPWPSLARLKLPVEYWPRSVRFAVCVPSVTVSVPLRWFLASLKVAAFFCRRRCPPGQSPR